MCRWRQELGGKGEQERGMGSAGVRAAEYGLGGGDPVAVPLCLILTVTMSCHITNDKSFRKRTWTVWDSNQELCDSQTLFSGAPTCTLPDPAQEEPGLQGAGGLPTGLHPGRSSRQRGNEHQVQGN